MSEILRHSENAVTREVPPYLSQVAGKVTVLEALAENTELIGPSRSNQSTPPQGDPDDQ